MNGLTRMQTLMELALLAMFCGYRIDPEVRRGDNQSPRAVIVVELKNAVDVSIDLPRSALQCTEYV